MLVLVVVVVVGGVGVCGGGEGGRGVSGDRKKRRGVICSMLGFRCDCGCSCGCGCGFGFGCGRGCPPSVFGCGGGRFFGPRCRLVRKLDQFHLGGW